MRELPLDELKKIFPDGSIPIYAMEFLKAIEDDPKITNEQAMAALQVIYNTKTDPRIGRALFVAKNEYSMRRDDGTIAKFEEILNEKEQGEFLMQLSIIFAAVFKDLDNLAEIQKRVQPDANQPMLFSD